MGCSITSCNRVRVWQVRFLRSPLRTTESPWALINRKGHVVPTYEMVAFAEFRTEQEIEQIIRDADDSIMFEAWSRMDRFIAAERVA